MDLAVSTADVDVRAACARVLAADPVGNTVFSSVAASLRPGDAWCAVSADGAVAARSQPSTPLALSMEWGDVSRLVPAVAALASLATINGPVAAVEAVVAGLGVEPATVVRERLFRCDVLRAPSGVPGSGRPADTQDRGLLVDWFAEFEDEAMGGAVGGRETAAAVERTLSRDRVWLWLDASGAPVSFARRQKAAHGVARIGPVYTPPHLRGHGYGSAVTAAATRDVLGGEAVPVLFTDLANPTSNAIYQRIGFEAVDDSVRIDFEREADADRA
jgi:GNAT superfamily N-acetyltransferase